MSGLAQSLTDAAAEAIDGHHKTHLGEAEDVVGAVLKVLRDDYWARPGWSDTGDDLDALRDDLREVTP